MPVAADRSQLDDRTWEALDDIARREATTSDALLLRIAEAGRSSRLQSAARIFIVEYYRAALTEAIGRDR
jgi:predicted DNA-binding ribbon-helix-helix protein